MFLSSVALNKADLNLCFCSGREITNLYWQCKPEELKGLILAALKAGGTFTHDACMKMCPIVPPSAHSTSHRNRNASGASRNHSCRLSNFQRLQENHGPPLALIYCNSLRSTRRFVSALCQQLQRQNKTLSASPLWNERYFLADTASGRSITI